MYTLNCRGKLLSLANPVVMGIMNATPDSFHTGQLQFSETEWIDLASQMIQDGASLIDIGGQSTRPGSIRLSAEDEMARVIPVIRLIHRNFPEVPISVDTYHAAVAIAAVEAGASLINDISGGEMDSKMITTAGALKVPYICMHMQGTPETMQIQPFYHQITLEITDYFIRKSAACLKAGIHDLIIDPGFGFGKTVAHNFQLLNELNQLNILDKPILVGLSRKSMIQKTLGVTSADALNGTTVLHTLALDRGAHILRTHDVRAAMEAIELVQATRNAS